MIIFMLLILFYTVYLNIKEKNPKKNPAAIQVAISNIGSKILAYIII